MRPTLLLDTCALIWIMNNADLSPAAVQHIDEAYDRGEPVYASPITAWEIGLQASRGRFKSMLTPQRWLEEVLRTPNMKVAELTPQVLLESSFLPGSPPRDPADRIIIASAREFGLTVITRDGPLLEYASQGYLRAIEC